LCTSAFQLSTIQLRIFMNFFCFR